MGIQVERTHSEAVAGGPDGPTFVCRKTGRNNWGPRQTVQPRVPVQGNKASKPLTENTCGGPRTYPNPLTWELAPEGPILLVGCKMEQEK